MKLWQIIYVNKLKNRIVFKIKTSYKLKLLTEGTMQLLGSSKNNMDKNKDCAKIRNGLGCFSTL